MSVWIWRTWIFSKLMDTVGQFSNVCLLPPLARELPGMAPEFRLHRPRHHPSPPSPSPSSPLFRRCLLLRAFLMQGGSESFHLLYFLFLVWCFSIVWVFYMPFTDCAVGLLYCGDFFFLVSLLLFLSWPVSSSGHLLPPSPPKTCLIVFFYVLNLIESLFLAWPRGREPSWGQSRVPICMGRWCSEALLIVCMTAITFFGRFFSFFFF